MRGLVMVGVVLGLLVAGCTSDPEADVEVTPAASSNTAALPDASGSPLGLGVLEERSVGDLVLGVTPLVRVGETVVLTLQAHAASGGSLRSVTKPFSANQTTGFDAARLVDTANRRVHLVAENGDGGCVCTGLTGIGAGETRPLQAAFTGVPAEVDRLAVMLPFAGVFADVPIVTGAVPQPPTGPDPLGREQEPLDLTGAAGAVAGLDAYTERLDVGLRERRTPESVDLDLATDVLFALDSAQLTTKARATLDAAARSVAAAGPGPVTITGHTDDTGAEAHNQTLSRQRADAVATALRTPLPDARWPKTVTAKGETAPAYPNDTAADRARNRRVTISFTPPTTGDSAPASAVPLPSTSGVRADASRGASLVLPLSRGTVRFTAGTVARHGPFAQVDLVATNVGSKPATVLDLLGQGVFTARDEFDPGARYGAAGVRMIAGATVAWGLDYQLEETVHRCLCDRNLNEAIPVGASRTIALWFPAPPAGVAAVTLDVPGELRLTDVPVG